ncbi:MAG: NADH-quinone oxidoreductase subunit NuoE [Armatimonadota bacterium]
MKNRIAKILVESGVAALSKQKRAALLLPILQRIQREFGYLPAESLSRVARAAGVPESQVYGVATFFAQFKFSPTGKHVVTVCRGTACHVRGSHGLLDDLRKRLRIEPGETTPDLQYTLQTVACFGSCALAPLVVINGKVYGRMTATRLHKVLDALAEKQVTETSAELVEVV